MFEIRTDLQDEAEEVPDAVGVELGEGFGAVAALEDEGLAGGALGQALLQRAALARKHQRREARDLGARLLHHLLQEEQSRRVEAGGAGLGRWRKRPG